MNKTNFKLSKQNVLGRIAGAMLAVFAFFLVFPPVFSDEKTQAAIDPATYSLTLSNNSDLALEISGSDSGNIGIMKDTVVVNTASPSGYDFYISSNDENNNIYLNQQETDDASKKISATTATFENPAELSLSGDINATWGFAITGSSNFDSSYDVESPSSSAKFAAVPTKSNEQLIRVYDEPAMEDSFDIYYGVKLNSNMSEGTYEKTILYTSVVELSEIIDGELEVSPAKIKSNYTQETITITTSLSTDRNLGNISATIGNKSCTNINITSQDPVTFTCELEPGLAKGKHNVTVNMPRLDRVYTQDEALTVKTGDYVSMQEFDTAACVALNIGQQVQLYDERDEKLYWVSRLDTNCWMTQNLDFDPNPNNITPDLTDVPATWTGAKATQTSYVAGDDAMGVQTYDAGNYAIIGGKTSTKTATTCTVEQNGGENCHYHLGNYYQYNVATAGVGGEMTSGTVDQSICPKGWTLPGAVAGVPGYVDLMSLYSIPATNDTKLLVAPFYFTRAGSTYSGAANYFGTRGYYWENLVATSANANYMRFYNGDATPAYANGKSHAINIRCIKRPEKFSLIYDINDGIGLVPASEEINVTESQHSFIVSSVSIPKKTGERFVGWSTDKNATTPEFVYSYANNDFTPSFIKIEPGETSLYAVYEPENKTLTDIQYMQEMNGAVCENTVVSGAGNEVERQLIDSRDGKKYWVGKLADGNCWMTQNLDFDVVSKQVYNPSTTDIQSAKSVTITDTWGTDNTKSYQHKNSEVYFSNKTTSTSSTGLASNSTLLHYHMGNSYSWNLATFASAVSGVGVEAPESICPYGWRLPEANVNGETSFGNLLDSYGLTNNGTATSDAALYNAPIYIAQYGYRKSGTLTTGKSFFWTSTADSSDKSMAYDLSGTNSTVSTETSNRYYGFSVRCVARRNPRSISYDLNGGNNAISKTTASDESSTATLDITTKRPSREGYTFLGWSTDKDAIVPEFAYNWGLGIVTPSQSTIYEDTILYAVWEQNDGVCQWSEGQQFTIGYTGASTEFGVPGDCAGVYKLEAYGASGERSGGKGGYSVGYVQLEDDENIYATVGASGANGGYNGGSKGEKMGTPDNNNNYYYIVGYGGGATHFAKVPGTLVEIGENNFITNGQGLIVAGGGGGGCKAGGAGTSTTASGGAGGGTSGSNGKTSKKGGSSPVAGVGGTQTKGYAFGRGGYGGGGGLYGGKNGSGLEAKYPEGSQVYLGAAGAGGGSGYIGGTPSFTYDGTQYAPSTQGDVQSGNGQAIVTLVKLK